MGQSITANWIDPQPLRSAHTGNVWQSPPQPVLRTRLQRCRLLRLQKHGRSRSVSPSQFRAELFNLFNRVNFAPPNISFAALPNGQFDPANGSAKSERHHRRLQRSPWHRCRRTLQRTVRREDHLLAQPLNSSPPTAPIRVSSGWGFLLPASSLPLPALHCSYVWNRRLHRSSVSRPRHH